MRVGGVVHRAQIGERRGSRASVLRLGAGATAAIVFVTISLAGSPRGASALQTAHSARELACGSTWSTVPSSTYPTDVRGLEVISPSDAWAVGSHSRNAVTTVAEHWDGNSWTLVSTPNPGLGDNSLKSVSAVGPSDVWAVGYDMPNARRTTMEQFNTLTEHWDGSSWSVVGSPNVGTASNSLTGVQALSSTDVWAVGYHGVAGGGQRRTLIEHWNGSSWSVVSSVDPASMSNSLLAVSGTSADDVWAAGDNSDGRGYSPLLEHWDGTRWSLVSVPVATAQDTVLTSVYATSETDAWIAGYQVLGSQMQPYTAHWDGTSWSIVPSPAPGSSYAAIHGISGTSHDAWVAGVGYDGNKNQFLGFTSHWDGSGWTTVRTALAAANAKSEEFAVAEVPGTDTVWSVGRPRDVEVLCTGSGITSAPQFSPSPQPWVAATDPTLPATGAGATPPGGWTLGTPTPVTASDEASAAGIAQTTLTHGAAVGDYDSDGLPDLLLNRHLESPAQLFHNNGTGSFTEVDVGTFKRHDRHGCTWGDVNQDGRLDLYCAAGSDRGTEGKHDELWIQRANHTFVDEAGQFGVIDPFGRGRISQFVDANGDRWPDILATNYPDRADGLPSPDRLFVNVRGTHFIDAPSFDLDLETGAGTVSRGDYNRDGYEDLIMDTTIGKRLYRNVSGTGYVDVGGSLGVKGNASDVKMADMNGDGRLDIVVATGSKLQTLLQSGGVFKLSATAAIVAGFRIAIGDVNDDNAPDVYLEQASKGSVGNEPDLVFLNNGNGTAFTRMSIPSTSIGVAEDVAPIDYDGNGLMDFVVENGNAQARNGPVQLIAFFRSP